MSSPSPKPILLLGAGELGLAILQGLVSHPHYNSTTQPIHVLLRPATLNSPSSSPKLTALTSLGATLVAGDINTDTVTALADVFRNYDTVVGCGSFYSPPGTQSKLAKAVLQAGVRRYFPWQFGLDYDVLGPEAGGGLMREQCGVRALLRGQQGSGGAATKWVIISVGIFMSFIFEEFFEVVVRARDGKEGGRKMVKVRALGAWDNKVTLSDAGDIGKVTADVLLHQPELNDRVVFMAGQTVTYEDLARALEENGWEVERELWGLAKLKKELEEQPENGLKKYQLVLAEGNGVSWDVKGTWNDEKGIPTTRITEWIKKNFAA